MDTFEKVGYAGLAYGLWKLIKWFFILFWPALIIEGCAKLFGSSITSWSETVKTAVIIISGIIGYAVYRFFRYANTEQIE